MRLPDWGDKRAFTLLELLLVMVLISLTISFAVPSLRTSLYTNELKAAARQLVGLIQQTGQRAVREQTSYQLRWEQNGRTFSAAPENASAESEAQSRLKLELPENITVPAFASFHAGNQPADSARILFSSRGYVDFTLIYLREDGGEELTVMLSPFLGASRIFEGHLELDDDDLPVHVED